MPPAINHSTADNGIASASGRIKMSSKPARSEIESHREFPMTQRAACCFHDDTEKREGPDDPEHR